MGLGERRGDTVVDIVNGVHPREIRIQGGAIIWGGSRGGGLVLHRFRDRGGRGLGRQGGTRGGSAYPM